jgi:membrane protease YdiL (CAAX protease family)
MASTLKHPVASIVGVIFALGWPLAFLFIPSQRHQDLVNLSQDRAIVIFEWAAVIVLALIIIFWERLELFASTGFRRLRRADIIIIAVLIALTIGAYVLTWARHGSTDATLMSYAAIPFGLRFVLVFTAGICEEFCFRGYAIERLTVLTGKPWIGAIAAIALFTLGHFGRYGFSQGLIVVAAIGAVLSFLYVWRRNIWPCIALHWFIDGTQLLVATAFIGHAH